MELYFFKIGGGGEGETAVGKVWRKIPVVESSDELRGGVFVFVGDQKLSRNRLLSRLNPDLPVDMIIGEEQMVAFDVVDRFRTHIEA